MQEELKKSALFQIYDLTFKHPVTSMRPEIKVSIGRADSYCMHERHSRERRFDKKALHGNLRRYRVAFSLYVILRHPICPKICHLPWGIWTSCNGSIGTSDPLPQTASQSIEPVVTNGHSDRRTDGPTERIWNLACTNNRFIS